MITHFVSLNCANCGGALEIYDDMEKFACGYCGHEIAVQRRGGTVVLHDLAEDSRKARINTQKADELLDLIRLKEEAQGLSRRREGMQTEKTNWQKWGYSIGSALLLVGFFAVRSGGFVKGLSMLMAGILTINFIRRKDKATIADVRELDLKIDLLNGRIQDREKLVNSSRERLAPRWD